MYFITNSYTEEYISRKPMTYEEAVRCMEENGYPYNWAIRDGCCGAGGFCITSRHLKERKEFFERKREHKKYWEQIFS